MDIDTIINSLENAENDNKRFALLLILAELIKTNRLDELKMSNYEQEATNTPTASEFKHKCEKLNEKLFASIGPNFLARLLTTRQTTENISPVLYKSVGMSILTQFLDYERLVCDPVIISKLDTICQILVDVNTCKRQEKDEENETKQRKNLYSDTFKYMFALSHFIPDHLCQNTKLLEILVNKIIFNEEYDPSYSKSIERVLMESNGEENFRLIACKLFSSLCKETKAANGHEQLKLDYNKLKRGKVQKYLKGILNFISTSTESEFKLCSIFYLNYLLNDENVMQCFQIGEQQEQAEELGEKMFNILESLFKSKHLNKMIKQRVAFVFLNNFVKMFDFEFIYMKNRNFFYLIIHLLCVEIGLCLQSSDYDQEYAINDQLVETMSVYYGLMEQVIIILSTASPFDTDSNDEENDEEIDNEAKNEPELKKVIKVIIECLETVLLYIKDNLDTEKKLNEKECVMVASSIRLLSCWVAHENLLDEKLVDLMPKIIKFCERYYPSSEKNNELQVNVFDFVIPALQRILIDYKDKLLEKTTSKTVEDGDETKLEYEKVEIKESIETITKLLNECYLHTESTK